jgi:serine protease Do
MGYGFAIPVDLVKAVVEDLVDDGEIDRGYIGVVIDEVDEVLARGLGLDEVGGVLIQNVNEGSAGEKAGLRSQDVILTVNGHQVNSPSELSDSGCILQGR